MKRAWLAVAALVTCGMTAFPAHGQTTAPGTEHVEQYRGLRRVHFVPNTEIYPAEAKSTPAAGKLGVVTVDLPELSSEGLPILETKTAPSSHAAESAPARTDEHAAPSQPGDAGPTELAPRLPVRNQGDAGAAAPPWYQGEWSHVAATLAAPLLPTLLVLLFLVVVVRRLKAQGPLIRVEHTGGQQGIALKDLAALMYGQGAREPAGATTPTWRDAPPAAEAPTTAQGFELGPTFEDERAAKEQETHNREQGMLQQLFDDNLKLREQLKNSDPAPPLAAEAQPILAA
jgi:hypothetical protein